MKSSLTLIPGQTTFSELESIYRDGRSARLSDNCRAIVNKAAQCIHVAAEGETPVYGVNTGFGKLADLKIATEDTAQLQTNLILSHCCGVGELMPSQLVRLMMVLKLLSFGRGASGVRWESVGMLEKMLEHELTPQVPTQGSVGASGDLAPLAHMTAVLIGAGEAQYKQQIFSGSKALAQAGLSPLRLSAKEGLAFINGTQFSTAYALAGLFEAWRAVQNAIVISALSTDAIMGSTAPLHPEIHALRGHPGQIKVAEVMRAILIGSAIRQSHLENDRRVQDPYCIRCQPQVTGAALDVLWQAAKTLLIEANSVTDNPLVLVGSEAIISGGNFHAEPVGFAADMMALAVAEIGSIAQRRIALMVDPNLNFGLPPFLTPDPGLNSGMMIAEVTTAALMSENKHLANPCVTDSTPTSANQEDHVSMAAHASRRLLPMVENLNYILAVELLCGVLGVEFRSPLQTSPILQKIIKRLREDVPSLGTDRYMAGDLQVAKHLVASGTLLDLVEIALPRLEEAN